MPKITLEKQVCSLELAKKLKSLGVEQESLFYWVEGLEIAEYPEGDAYESWYEDDALELVDRARAEEAMEVKDSGEYEDTENIDYYAAFTVAELGEMLPSEVATNKYTEPDLTSFMCKLHVEGDWSKYIELIEADTEADARAKMLIYLIENELVDVNQLNHA